MEGQTLTLIIGQYHAQNYSPTGRGTKGYFAYVMGQSRLVFLNLVWRANSQDIWPEHETYRNLYDANVPNIPQLITGGDVLHTSGEKIRTRTTSSS